MNKIKLNNIELEVEAYTRNTTFSGEEITSTGYCTVNVDEVAVLNSLGEEEITSIQIYHDETLIYNISNIKARVSAINEYLNDNKMTININLIFDNE